MLLVLDDLEQVTGLASFLSDLLRSCPHLRLLVTSRRPLHLQEEQKFPLGLRLREDVHHRAIQRAATKLLLHANCGDAWLLRRHLLRHAGQHHQMLPRQFQPVKCGLRSLLMRTAS